MRRRTGIWPRHRPLSVDFHAVSNMCAATGTTRPPRIHNDLGTCPWCLSSITGVAFASVISADTVSANVAVDGMHIETWLWARDKPNSSLHVRPLIVSSTPHPDARSITPTIHNLFYRNIGTGTVCNMNARRKGEQPDCPSPASQ